MRGEWRNRLSAMLAAAVIMMALTPHIGMVEGLPEEMVIHSGSVAEFPMSVAVSAGVEAPENVIAGMERTPGRGHIQLTAGEEGEAELTFRLLGLVPVASMKVSVQSERRLIPGGQSVGVAINTEGLMVVGSSDLGQTPSPARLAGLRSGDVIRSIDGNPVSRSEDLSSYLMDGSASRFEILRGEEILTKDIAPAKDVRDGAWRLGVWVRDSTAGVGTLTYYDPANNGFGALGHAITDIDTGEIMPVGEGAIYENSIISITPSEQGTPGELTGDFFGIDHALGEVTGNSDSGIFGTADAPIKNSLYPEGLPMATRSEIREGPATLLTTLDERGIREYECEIISISDKARSATRSMVIRITDDELIARTGGIVQGMSGSPIIQDGKLVGAVTHVLVNEPTKGYGIFIENMLDAAG